MAISPDHMQSVYLRRLAMARAAFALLARADEHEPVLKVMNAEPGCRAAAGLTAGQEASMLAAINSDQFSAQAAADVVSDIIATNHGHDKLALAAEDIDLISMLRRIEREVAEVDFTTLSANGGRGAPSPAQARDAVFRLQKIAFMVAPLLTLLDTQAHDAGQSYAAAAE